MGKEGQVLNFYQDIFVPTCARMPWKVAIEFEGHQLTYGALADAVARFAQKIWRHTNPGDRVTLLLPNTPNFDIAYLAAQSVERIAVPCNPLLTRPEIAHILNDTSTRVIVTDPALCENMPAAKEIPSVERVFLSAPMPPLNAQFSGYNTSVLPVYHDAEAGTPAPAAGVPKHLAVILYTSGTTGKQKGAMLSHRNVITNAREAARRMQLTETDRLLCFLPRFHCFGLNFITAAAYSVGATIVLHRRWDEKSVLESLRDRSVTVFLSAPPIYQRLLARIHWEDDTNTKASFETVRYFFSAAATLPEETNRRWAEIFGRPICQGYGLTETSPFATENCSQKNYRKGSVGKAISGVEIKIIDPETGKDLPRGPEHIGEICVKGENVMLGYWMRPVETARVLKDSWFHTGDSGWMDEDGYLYYVDRYKDMVNFGGFKIWPREVEDVLVENESVKEVTVIGIPDPEYGEIPVAVVVFSNLYLPDSPTTGRPLWTDDPIYSRSLGDTMRAFCKGRLALYKIPRYVFFCTESGLAKFKSPTGKILKRMLRDKLAGLVPKDK